MSQDNQPVEIVVDDGKPQLDDDQSEVGDDGAKVGRVLDVGTGTGIWALDFGDEHPEAEVS
ncbi:methyltransferase domain-containing protein [Colletotrichum higginsianum]|nr:methyltransferase domain-containing protein [Colletotrichum higginsianum]